MGAAGTPTVEEEDPVPGIKPIKKKPVVVHTHTHMRWQWYEFSKIGLT